jgi:hypothetical protein
MKNNLIIGAVVAVIVISTASFYGGMMYGKSTGFPKGFEQMGTIPGGNQNLRTGQNGGGLTTGEIISKDDQSITIKTKDNSSKIIFYSGTTEINKFTGGSSADIEVGKTVMITGTTNQDSSITAKTIQIGQRNPIPPQ